MRMLCLSVLLALLCGCTVVTVRDEPVRLVLKTRPFFIERGERVAFDFHIRRRFQQEETEFEYISTLLRPGESYEKLFPVGVDTHFAFGVDEESRDGLYVATGYVRVKKDGFPLTLAIAKRSFLLGRIVADFLHLPLLPSSGVKEYLRGYIERFKALGGNLLIVHPLVTDERALYPSNVCERRLLSETDVLAQILSECDTAGIAVLLSLGWDVSSRKPHIHRFQSLERIMSELYHNYGAHPSFCGFYSYLDGGSLDYALYIRTFAKLVKSLDEGLLTACSVLYGEPLLAGYLAAFEDLDIILPRTMFSRSRSVDDRRAFPAYRAADFVRIFATAGNLGKVVLPSVELFLPDGSGHISPSDVKKQILAVASVNGVRGILLDSYHRDVFALVGKKAEAEEVESAVNDSLVAFKAIQDEFRLTPPVAIYYPLGRYIADSGKLLELLDSLRSRGVPARVVVFVPARSESLPPFPPTSPNREQVRFLAENGVVILLAGLPALASPDCSFLLDSLSAGSTFIVSSLPLPTGPGFEQETLFGIGGIKRIKTKELLFRYDIGDFRDRDTIRFDEEVELPFMEHRSGIKVLAVDDEHSLLQLVPFAEGRLYVTTLGMDEQRGGLRKVVTELIRDAVSFSRGEEMPLMLSELPPSTQTDYRWNDGTLVLLLVNPSNEVLEVEVAVPKRLSDGCRIRYLNKTAESITQKVKDKKSFKLKVEPNWYLLLRLEPLESEEAP